jgi:transposase
MDIRMSGHEGLGEEGQDAWRKRRRLKRSDAERDEIVRASFAPGASIAGVAREYGVNANLLWNWRRKFKRSGGTLALPLAAGVDFVPVSLAKETNIPASGDRHGLMELSLPGGTRIILDTHVDERALVRVLCALKAAA